MPINTAYVGALLKNVLVDSCASIAIVHPQLLDKVLEVKAENIRQAVVMGAVVDPAHANCGVPIYCSTALTAPSIPLQPLSRSIEPWDTQSIIYTRAPPARPRVCCHPTSTATHRSAHTRGVASGMRTASWCIYRYSISAAHS